MANLTYVTFREEGVDWNSPAKNFTSAAVVTFREEGVDWNSYIRESSVPTTVTFREEGVDWNTYNQIAIKTSVKSPSARKVWIEIIYVNNLVYLVCVTFREEGVDWNMR